MSKICYVIMPYGGSDEVRRKRFKSIFSAIIKPAAENKGYTVIREDHEARQGNIGANIIKSLAEADIVIADLSENNWNVAYELGIRHALNKSGTILIMDKKTPLMFDIQGNKVITYSDEWYDSIDETQQSIIDSIDYYEKNNSSSDSPVHDIYTRFPVKLIEYLVNNDDKEKAKIAKLIEENNKLRELVNSAGLSDDAKPERSDISMEFREALSKSQYSGTKALIKLQSHIDDEEEFVNTLALIMSKGFLSEDDSSRIYWMCNKLDNYFVTITFLEEIVRRYPENEEFSGRLAREYARSAENREKAIFRVNKNVGVKKENNRYILEKKTVTHNILASFFDVYIQLDKYADILEISQLLLHMYPIHSELIRRNIVTAYRLLGEYAKAEEVAKQLVENNPVAVNHYSLYRVYYSTDDYSSAYEQLEACVIAEPDDVDYLIWMAGLIMDSSYVRVKNGYVSEIGKVAKKQAMEAAVPFVFEAYANQCGYSRCMDFLTKNNLKEAAALLNECAQKNIVPREDTDSYNYYPLNCCLRKAE